MSSQYATSYDSPPAYSASASGQTTTSQETGIIDQQYYRGIPGILKFCEMGFSLIGFICAATSFVTCSMTTTGYFNFITMAAFTTTLILYVIFLFKLQKRIFKCACINWPLVEVVYYSAIVIFLFFGDLFMSIYACHMAYQAGVAFGWFALVAYIIDLILAVLNFRKGQVVLTQQHETHFSSVTTSSRY